MPTRKIELFVPAIKAAEAARARDDAFARVRLRFVATRPAHDQAIAQAVKLAGPQSAL